MFIVDRNKENIVLSIPYNLAMEVTTSILQSVVCMLNDIRLNKMLISKQELERINFSVNTLVNFANELSHPNMIRLGYQEVLQHLMETILIAYNKQNFKQCDDILKKIEKLLTEENENLNVQS